MKPFLLLLLASSICQAQTPSSYSEPYRLIVIDGPELVCLDGTGDKPLFMYTIDPQKCGGTIADTQVPEAAMPGSDEPATPREGEPSGHPDVSAFIPAVPEPETWALILAGLGFIGWRKR